MSQLDFDITKRMNASRKWKKMADLRLSKEMSKPGGMEDEKNYHLAELKKERDLLQKELQALRFESKISASKKRENYDYLTRSSENLQNSSNWSTRRYSSDYGKNYHGYISLPGSKKLIKKSAREMEKSLDDYCKKIDELIHRELIDQKLEEQKKENESVDKKLKTWLRTNSTTRKTLPKLYNSYHQATNEDKEVKSNSNNFQSSAETSLQTELVSNDHHSPTIENHCNQYTEVDTKWSTDDDVDSDRLKYPTYQNNIPSLTNVQDLVFDADLYAPDGRIRMAHRMPEFQLAYEQARKTRYVRTKTKRDFEIPLSTQDIFK